MRRDDDPDQFENLLLETGGDDSSVLKVKDIGYSDEGKQLSLRLYSFNLPQYMMSKVMVDINNIKLSIRKNGQNSNDETDWFASYEKKTSFYEVIM